MAAHSNISSAGDCVTEMECPLHVKNEVSPVCLCKSYCITRYPVSPCLPFPTLAEGNLGSESLAKEEPLQLSSIPSGTTESSYSAKRPSVSLGHADISIQCLSDTLVPAQPTGSSYPGITIICRDEGPHTEACSAQVEADLTFCFGNG